MNFTSTFRLALRALARNKMRSALTMLGIIIGVGAVIAVVSIGQGAQYMVQQGIQAMGTNVVFIAAGSGRPGGIRVGYGGVKTLTIDDMKAILREIPLIKEAAPSVNSRRQLDDAMWYTKQLQNQLARVNPKTEVFQEYELKRPESSTHGLVTDSN